MAPHARDNGISRRSWLLAGLAFPLFGARAASPMSVSYDGDNLRPIAPTLHFLTGKSLDHLKDGDSVTYVSWLQLFTMDRRLIREVRPVFTVSYDIWEEKFQVTLPGAAPRTRRDLTAAEAEAWCLNNTVISASGLAPDLPFYLRMEMRTAPPKELSNVIADPGISLRAVVELFSRKPGADDPQWGPFESGLLRLSNLPRTAGRGARNG